MIEELVRNPHCFLLTASIDMANRRECDSKYSSQDCEQLQPCCPKQVAFCRGALSSSSCFRITVEYVASGDTDDKRLCEDSILLECRKAFAVRSTCR